MSQITPEQLAAFQAFQQQQAAAQAQGQQPAPSLPSTNPQAAGLPSLAGAKAGNANGRNIPPGEHVFDVAAVKVTIGGQNRQPYFVVECTAVESDNPSVQIGGEYSFVKPFHDQYGYSANDIKGWICEAVELLQPGSNPAQNWDDNLIRYVADEVKNPCKGLRFSVSAWEKQSQGRGKLDAGKAFTVYQWSGMEQGASRGLIPAVGGDLFGG